MAARGRDGGVEEIGHGVRGMHACILALFSVHGCYFLRCVYVLVPDVRTLSVPQISSLLFS
jgi:hypothetical protein